MSDLLARLKAEANRLGEPHAVDRPLLEALCGEFYALPGNGAGGSLHNVLDDCNVGADSVEWCREYARKEGDEIAFWLAQVLLACSEDDRVWLCGGDDETEADDDVA